MLQSFTNSVSIARSFQSVLNRSCQTRQFFNNQFITPKVRRTLYNLGFKLKVVAEPEAVENNSEIARDYGISESVHHWRKDQASLFNGFNRELKMSAKRKTMGCYTPKPDENVLEWFTEQRSQGKC